MADMFRPTLHDMIVEAEREVAFRKRVYPRQVMLRKMTQEKADRQLQLMEAIAAELSRVKAVFGERK